MSELDVQKAFVLDPQLAADTVLLGDFPVSQVLLSKDANYPWCILVPKREGLREVFHMSVEDRDQLTKESCHLAEVMADLFVPDKMNIAALGNMVPQLHIHHVARTKGDSAWPKPIWGVVEAKPYSDEDLRSCVSRLRSALASDMFVPADQ